jgi:hypothetical protein
MAKQQSESMKDEIKTLVIERLRAMPENLKIAVGDEGEFDKYELIERVKLGDDVGKEIVEAQLNFLRNMRKLATIAAQNG